MELVSPLVVLAIVVAIVHARAPAEGIEIATPVASAVWQRRLLGSRWGFLVAWKDTVVAPQRSDWTSGSFRPLSTVEAINSPISASEE